MVIFVSIRLTIKINENN